MKDVTLNDLKRLVETLDNDAPIPKLETPQVFDEEIVEAAKEAKDNMFKSLLKEIEENESKISALEESAKYLPALKEQQADPLLSEKVATLEGLQKQQKLLITRLQTQLATIGGGGETQLRYLDDIVGIATNLSGYNGQFLKIDTSNSAQPFVFAETSGGSGVTTAAVRDAIQGYYGYETDFYTVGTANTSQEIGAGTTTMILPQVASVFQALPTIMTGIGTNPYVGTAATIGTGQTEFSFAGLTSGASCIVRTALAFNPDEDNTNLDIQLKFTTNTATQAAGTTNFTMLKESALIMNEGADQQYITENVFSFLIGTKLEGTTYDNAGSFNIEVIPTNDGTLEVLAVTVNVVA